MQVLRPLKHLVDFCHAWQGCWCQTGSLILMSDASIVVSKFRSPAGRVRDLQLVSTRDQCWCERGLLTSFSDASKSKLSRCRFTDSPYVGPGPRPGFLPSSKRFASGPSGRQPCGAYRAGPVYAAGVKPFWATLLGGAESGCD